jgi:hypothetical protein
MATTNPMFTNVSGNTCGSEASKRDEDYTMLKPGVCDITWEELQCAQWHNPPKHCSKCGKSKCPGQYTNISMLYNFNILTIIF